MFQGRPIHYAKLQIRCGFTSASSTFTMNAGGVKTVEFDCQAAFLIDTYYGPQAAFWMRVQGQKVSNSDIYPPAGATAGTVRSEGTTYTLNWAGTTYTHTLSTFNIGGSFHYLEIDNFNSWIGPAGSWIQEWGEVRWYDETHTLINTISSGGNATTTWTGINPSTMPVFTGVFYMGGGGTGFVSEYESNIIMPLPGGWSFDTTSTTLSGWRWQDDDGNWHAPNVYWPSVSGVPSPAGDTTWSISVPSTYEQSNTFDLTGTYDSSNYMMGCTNYVFKSTSVQAVVIPNGDMNWLRIVDGHEQPVTFWGADELKVGSRYSHGGLGYVSGGVYEAVDWAGQFRQSTDPYAYTDTVTSLYSALGSETHLVKDARGSRETAQFVGHIPSMLNINVGDASWHTVSGGTYKVPISGYTGTIELLTLDIINWYSSYPTEDPNRQIIAPTNDMAGHAAQYPLIGSTGSVLTYLTSTDLIVEPWTVAYGGPSILQIFNTWCHPHWSAFYALEAGNTMEFQGSDGPRGWTTTNEDGDIVPDYFCQVQQTYNLDVVPSGERTDHRASQVWPPFNSNALPYAGQVSGYPYGFWASSDGAVWLKPAPLASATLDHRSAARWACHKSDGTTATLTVDDTGYLMGVGGVKLFFDMSNWDTYPFGWTQIVTGIEFANPLSNIASWVAEILGEDGTVVRVASSTGNHAIPSGNNKEWSISNAIGMRSGPLLRITVVPTDAGATCKFAQIVMHAATLDQMKAYTLSARCSAIAIDNGPSLLIGPQQFYDPITDSILDTPEINLADADGQMSAGDLACFYLSVFLAKQPTVELHAFMEQYFVYAGGDFTEWTLLHHFWQDPFNQYQLTTGFVIGPTPRFVMQNSYRSIPPLAINQTKKRTNADGWDGSGSGSLNGYALGNTKHHVISTEPLQLIPPVGAVSAGTNILSADGTSPSGWHVQYYQQRVSNDETFDHPYIVRKGKDYAGVRPWRGFIWTGLPDSGRGAILGDAIGLVHRVRFDDAGYVVFERSLGAPVSGWQNTVRVSADGGHNWASLAIGRYNRLFVVWEDPTGILMATSDDYTQDAGPVTFSTPSLICAGAKPMIASNKIGTVLLLARQSDGTILGTRYRTGETDTFTLKDTGGANLMCEDQGLGLTASAAPVHPWHLEMVHQGDTAETHWISTDDGKTWQSIA